MAGSLNVVAPDLAHDAMAEALLEHGYIVIEDLAPDLTARAFAELAPQIEAAPFGSTEFLGLRTKRLGSLFRRSMAAREMVVHPTVMALCDRLLLPHCARYQLNFSGVMHLEPGADGQTLHRDGVLYPLLHPHPPMVMPVMWALSDFTAENGGTQIAPGSHLWDHDRVPFTDEVVSAEMPAGSALIYTGGLYHGGGPNRGNSARTGMALQYSLGWLRQEENQYLANPPEVAKDYPERLQRLIGYDFGGPYLGFVDGDNPHRLLEGDRDGIAERTNPELDAAADKIEWLRWGEMAAVATPDRAGETTDAATKRPDNG